MEFDLARSNIMMASFSYLYDLLCLYLVLMGMVPYVANDTYGCWMCLNGLYSVILVVIQSILYKLHCLR